MSQHNEQSVHQLYRRPSFRRAEGEHDQTSERANQQCLSRKVRQERNPRNTKKSMRIKVQKCARNDDKTPEAKQCRICLEGEQEGRMIKPCLCSGSVTFVHEKCIMEWIKRRHDPKASKNKLLCQMCHTPFNYKFGKRRKLDAEQFCSNYQKQRCNFVLFYAFVSFLLLVVISLIVVVSESSSDSEIGIKIKSIFIKSENVKIIYICVIFILLIVLMFLLILFMIEYAVKSELVISEVMNYSEYGVKKKSRIYPRLSDHAANLRPTQNSGT